MLRRFVLVVLALAMLGPLSPPALAGAGSGSGVLDSHALLHWIGGAHDHHHDGGYDLGGSADALAHVAADAVNGVGLPSQAASTTPPDLAHLAPRHAFIAHAPPPWLDGPLRPPR
jgi:hypothetical protein